MATVSQLRTAINLEPRPDPGRPDPRPAITKTSDEAFDFWRITLPHTESAIFEAALQSHRDALIAEWRQDRDDERAPVPTAIDAFLRLVETGWDGEVQRGPTGNAPPWWCTSTSTGRSARCTSARCYRTPSGST